MIAIVSRPGDQLHKYSLVPNIVSSIFSPHSTQYSVSTQCLYLQESLSSSTPSTATSARVGSSLAYSRSFAHIPINSRRGRQGRSRGRWWLCQNIPVCPFISQPQHSPKIPLYRIAETLSDDILKALHAPAKPDYPIFTPKELVDYDAFIFGVPTRYGSFPAQWKVIPNSPPRLLDRITETDSQTCRRPFGMLLVGSGSRVPSLASTLVSSFLPVPPEEGRR